MLSFFPLSTGLTDIFSVCIHDLHDLHEITKKIAMLFIIWTWKAYNLVENQTNLTEKLKNLGSAEPIEPAFWKYVYPTIFSWLLYNSAKM